MHRKSAYILFLAVLGLLAIGIVILFSTGAFAKTATATFIFSCERHAIWLGIGLVACIAGGLDRLPFLAAHLVDLVCDSRSLGSLSVFFRRSGTGSMAPGAGWNFTASPVSPRSLPKSRPSSSSPSGFRAMKNRANKSGDGFILPMAIVSLLLSLIITEVDLGHDRR